MRRILEPEVMDTERDAEEYDAMDFLESDTRFAEDALALLGERAFPSILDIGTGTAKIPLLMLERRVDLAILAVDMAEAMLRVAARRISAARFDERCKLAAMDAKALAVPDAKFDMVMCNSTAHHVPDPADLFREIARVVKPDGAIIIRDLARPETMDDAWAIVRRVAAGDQIRQQQLFFDSLCAALTVSEVERIVLDVGLERARVAMCSDRHWTVERAAQGRPATSVRPTRR